MAIFGGLDRLPGSSQLHVWADWFEILVYTSAVEEFSITEFTETVERREDYLAIETSDDMDPKTFKRDPLESFSGAELRDAVAQRGEDILEYMSARKDSLGVFYPFEIDDDAKVVQVASLDRAKLMYVFILACSALRYVPEKSIRYKLTSAFELLSLKAMENFVPSKAEMHVFGKNALSHGPFSSGLLVDKISALAECLGERVVFDPAKFEVGDTGDNGLDLVAWSEMGDSLGGRLVFFGQCACTSEWVSKQHSSSADAWSSVISFTAKPVNLCFIPHDFRRTDRSWYADHHIHSSVLIDRQRLLAALGDGPGMIGLSQDVDETLEDLLLYKEIAASRGQDVHDI